MRDRLFWILALGVFPAAFLVLVFAQLFGVPALLGTPAMLLLLVAEGPVLWRVVDPDVRGFIARTRRAALGLVVTIVAALLGGGTIFAVTLVLVLGPDG